MKFPDAIKVNELDIHVSIHINLKMIMLTGKILLKDTYDIIVLIGKNYPSL